MNDQHTPIPRPHPSPFQIKEKAWKGLREHSMDGWNIGPAPYGYQPEHIPHPAAAD